MADKEPDEIEDDSFEELEDESFDELDDQVEELESDDESDESLEDSEEEDDSEEETESEDESENAEAEDQPQEESEAEAEQEGSADEAEADAAELKAQEAFKERQARREAERKLREQQEATERQNLQRYLEEAGADEAEQQKRQNEVNAYLIQKREVEVNERALEADLKRAVADIDLFQTGSQEVKDALFDAVDDFDRMFVVRDEQGNPLRVEGDVHEYLTKKADSIRRLTGVGARESKKNSTKTKARTMSAPSRKPAEPKKDPLLAAFDEAWESYE